ncbi:MAG: Uncharacterised protein [Flavobacteriia bacterium]|nr:MAG: Uncharacterised protein [Flavobacteriia bacterium]
MLVEGGVQTHHQFGCRSTEAHNGQTHDDGRYAQVKSDRRGAPDQGFTAYEQEGQSDEDVKSVLHAFRNSLSS